MAAKFGVGWEATIDGDGLRKRCSWRLARLAYMTGISVGIIMEEAGQRWICRKHAYAPAMQSQRRETSRNE